MKRSIMQPALVFALITLSFGLSACHDEHPDRGDHRPGDHHDFGGRDSDNRDRPHN